MEYERKLRRIFCVNLELNINVNIAVRGRAKLGNFNYILSQCEINNDLGILDDKRLRNIIHHLYKFKH